jgi:hypothetical protein
LNAAIILSFCFFLDLNFRSANLLSSLTYLTHAPGIL